MRITRIEWIRGNRVLTAALTVAVLLGVALVAWLASQSEPAAARAPETTVSSAVEAAQSETETVEDRWAASLRSSVEEASAELDFRVFSLGDSFNGYPLTEIRVMNGSLYLYYRFYPQSAEAEAAGWEGFLIREFSTADNLAHIGELQAEYPVVDTVSRGASGYEIRRGAGENRSLVMMERQGTTLMVGMFVKPDPSALADAADALKEAVR